MGAGDTVGSYNLVAVDTPDNQDIHKVQVVLVVQDILDSSDSADNHTLDVADSRIARKGLIAPVVAVVHWERSDRHCRNHIARIEVELVAALVQEVVQ